ncbi:hypothetical protein T492DRAFT_880111 [Pavlovales sp. CCMP2436]|nr:hypothetical protein T492DRAFT_880111 [Pavlovales sp. CCMP2436]
MLALLHAKHCRGGCALAYCKALKAPSTPAPTPASGAGEDSTGTPKAGSSCAAGKKLVALGRDGAPVSEDGGKSAKPPRSPPTEARAAKAAKAARVKAAAATAVGAPATDGAPAAAAPVSDGLDDGAKASAPGADGDEEPPATEEAFGGK